MAFALPSPVGRRCPEGADEDSGEAWGKETHGHPRPGPCASTGCCQGGTGASQVASLVSGEWGFDSRRALEWFAPDQHAADLRGAVANLVQLGVAPQAPGRILVDVAVAAEDLARLIGRQR